MTYAKSALTSGFCVSPDYVNAARRLISIVYEEVYFPNLLN